MTKLYKLSLIFLIFLNTIDSAYVSKDTSFEKEIKASSIDTTENTNGKLMAKNNFLSLVEIQKTATSLDLSKNGYTEIPDQIKLFKKLNFLSIKGNNITQIPFGLKNLIFLDISCNEITSFSLEKFPFII